jgi:hypothetical protein
MDVSFLLFIFQCVHESRMEGILTESLSWMVDLSKSPSFISRSYDITASLFCLASFPSVASTRCHCS